MKLTHLPEELLPEVVRPGEVTLAKMLKPKIDEAMSQNGRVDVNALAKEFGRASRREIRFNQAFSIARRWLEEDGKWMLIQVMDGTRHTGVYREAVGKERLCGIDRYNDRIASAGRRSAARAELTRGKETDPRILKGVERRQEIMNRRLVLTEIVRLRPTAELPAVGRARR